MKQKLLITTFILFSGILKSQTTDLLFYTDKQTIDSKLISHVKIYYQDTSVYTRLFFYNQSCEFKNVPLGLVEARFFTQFNDSIVVKLNLTKKRKQTKVKFPINNIYTINTSSQTLTDNWIKNGGNFQVYITTRAGCMEFWEQKFEFCNSANSIKCYYWRQNFGVTELQDTILIATKLPVEILNKLRNFENTPLAIDYSNCYTKRGPTYCNAIVFYNNNYLEIPFCPTTNTDFQYILNTITKNAVRYIYP